MKVIVLAGGGGTRLWPLSRQDFPKQFLHFDDHLSLLQKTVGRFLNVSFAEDVVVATSCQYQTLVEQQLNQMEGENKADILIEPARRNTAPAIALAVKYLQECKGAKDDTVILVMPSDHMIEPESVFIRFLEQAEEWARKQIVLFGIHPTRPETGYGYIQIGAQAEGLQYPVQRFVEKPDLQHAEQYLTSGDYYWNAGIFAFCPKVFWEELKCLAPDIFQLMQGDYASCLTRFSQMPEVSFDYAILEKTKKISVCPIPITWSDVGSWDSLYEVLAKDQNQNVKVGNVHEIDTKNSLIMGGKRLISTIGLEDMLIVETDDATFISKKGESQKVKELVQELVKIGRREGSISAFKEHPWGNVKQLYKSDRFSVECYQVQPLQSFEHIVRDKVVENWLVLTGQLETDGKKIQASQSLQFKKPATFIVKNTSQEIGEVLVTTYEPVAKLPLCPNSHFYASSSNCSQIAYS